MSDLRLDPVTGDLDISNDALYLTDGADALAQRLKLRLSMQTGEWFLNITDGIDWRGLVFVRTPDLATLGVQLRQRILSTPEVLQLLDFSINFDQVSGNLAIVFSVLTEVGEIETTVSADDVGAVIVTTLMRGVRGIAP